MTGIDPFDQCLTIASACNLVYRTKFLNKDTIAIIPPHGYRPEDKYSMFALKWLSFFSEKNDVCIQHARNASEKRVDKYLLDGYDPETSTVYEINGCFWHGKTMWFTTCFVSSNSMKTFLIVGGLKCHARDNVNPVNGKSMHELHQAAMEKSITLRTRGIM